MIALWQDPLRPQAGHDVGGVQTLHVMGLVALGLLIFATLVLPRRRSSLPLVLLLCFVPVSQRFVIDSLDFPFLRLLILTIWLRLVVRHELRPLKWNWLDRGLLIWAMASIATATLYANRFDVFVNRTGASFDSLGVYFFFRQHVRSMRDLSRVAGHFLACVFPVLVFFFIEHLTQRNLFHVLGGVPEYTLIRDGRLRCQGAFAHPIVAGCFFASLIPLLVIRGLQIGRWGLVTAGSAACLAIVVLCASSTPVVAVFAGIFGASCFFLRAGLRYIRWAFVIGLVCLHFLRDKPVWHLISRIDITGGSTGFHRYHLVDKFFLNWQEWLWLGTPSTAHWGNGLQDVTNQYVAEGVSGGILRLILFLAVIATSFIGLSRSLRQPGISRHQQLAYWTLGTALFMHCVNFIGITYFGQMVALWMATLGVIGSLTLVPGTVPSTQLQRHATGLAGA